MTLCALSEFAPQSLREKNENDFHAEIAEEAQSPLRINPHRLCDLSEQLCVLCVKKPTLIPLSGNTLFGFLSF